MTFTIYTDNIQVFFMLITFLNRGKSSESSRDVYLSNVNCLGVEDSVIACEGSGWRNVNQSLCNHENDAGVYCYESGKWIDWLIDGWMDEWMDEVDSHI